MTERPTIPLKPIPESYWVIPHQFLAGEYPISTSPVTARARLRAFLQDGFNTFIDLTTPGELEPYLPLLEKEASRLHQTIHYQRFPIGNFGLPTPETMRQILDTLDAALAQNRKIYLHCWGGVGRTGTVVGCYLVRHGLSGEQALRQINEWWRHVPKSIFFPHTPETEAQKLFILTWREDPRPGEADA